MHHRVAGARRDCRAPLFDRVHKRRGCALQGTASSAGAGMRLHSSLTESSTCERWRGAATCGSIPCPSIHACRLPSRCSTRRASPPTRSNATAPRRPSSRIWRGSRSASPSTVSRASRRRSGGCSGPVRARPRISRASTSSVRSAAARPCSWICSSRHHRSRASDACISTNSWPMCTSASTCCGRRRSWAKPTARIRSPLPPSRSRKRLGFYASTNSTSPISPMR